MYKSLASYKHLESSPAGPVLTVLSCSKGCPHLLVSQLPASEIQGRLCVSGLVLPSRLGYGLVLNGCHTHLCYCEAVLH